MHTGNTYHRKDKTSNLTLQPFHKKLFY